MQIKNIKTKVLAEVSEEDFKAIKKNPLTADLWVAVEKAKTPPEVKALQDKNVTAKDEMPKNQSK